MKIAKMNRKIDALTDEGLEVLRRRVEVCAARCKSRRDAAGYGEDAESAKWFGPYLALDRLRRLERMIFRLRGRRARAKYLGGLYR